ncbi:MAG: hypothetical protein U1F16_04460 [Turneriella sp.]
MPEIEAIATEVLSEFEQVGIRVVPTARAAQLTMAVKAFVASPLKN